MSIDIVLLLSFLFNGIVSLLLIGEAFDAGLAVRLARAVMGLVKAFGHLDPEIVFFIHQV